MEKMLLRLARQLESLDEASLMSLWSKYATTASHFAPTREWEEAVLVLSLIQAKRWKNQLFNYHWASQVQPRTDSNIPEMPGFTLEPEMPESRPCRILAFPDSNPNAENEEK